MLLSPVEFCTAARLIGQEARRSGIAPPGFRSPPRLPGVTRSIRRGPSGAVVAVAVRGRPSGDVLADMIEGVVLAAALDEHASVDLRQRLRAAVGWESPEVAPLDAAA